MVFTVDDVENRPTHAGAPDPGMDVHWWRVRLGPDKFGWAYHSVYETPSAEEVADELTKQSIRRGKALESLLRSGRGLELEAFRHRS